MTLDRWQQPSHVEARELICAAFQRRFGRLPTKSEAECCQGIGWLETHYSGAWKTPGDGSCNWGAVQCHYPCCKTTRIVGAIWGESTCFAYVDTHPNDDGSSTRYAVCFKAHDNHDAGADELVYQVYVGPNGCRSRVLAAATAGNVLGVSQGLHATKYFEGWGATKEERIQHHYEALSGSIKIAQNALNAAGHPAVEVPARVAQLGLLDWQTLREENQAAAIAERDREVAETPDGTT